MPRLLHLYRGLALWPIGKMVVTIDEADRLRYAPWRARAY